MKLVAFKQFLSLFAFTLMLALFQPAAYAEDVAAASSGGAVNINTASAAELASSLDGIGESKAEAIVSYREANGSFSSVEELLEVKGIGESTLDKNRDKIKIK